MAGYFSFIPQNVAPIEARRIGVYKDNNRIGYIPLGNLKLQDVGNKQYSFGSVSDIHLDETNITYPTSISDFKKALTFYNDNNEIDFLCICGDLSILGKREQLQVYKDMIEEYIQNKPVYVAAGNHEEYTAYSHDYYEELVGCPLYYSFEYYNDVFIMIGVISSHEGRLFADGELQWLQETLENNRNKRCFVFQHILTQEGCGDAINVYTGSKLNTATESIVFKSLISHYKNAIHFHGHSHFMFELQELSDSANYDYVFGTHSVHIPSLTVPRGADPIKNILTSKVSESEGYIIDVYENGIHLRGRDFIRDRYLPIASYWLDTTVKEVAAGTYLDPTGTINTAQGGE